MTGFTENQKRAYVHGGQFAIIFGLVLQRTGNVSVAIIVTGIAIMIYGVLEMKP